MVPLVVTGVLLVATGAAGGEITVMITIFEVAVLTVLHGALEVTTQVTLALFNNADEVNVVELVPEFVPFTFHWYDGVVPQLVGTAVNDTDAPLQIVVVVADIATDGVVL